MSAGRICSWYWVLSRAMAVGSVELGLGAARDAAARAALGGHADARRTAVLGVDEHDVGDVDRAFLLDDAADLFGALRVGDLHRALVALDDVQPLDVDALLLRVDAQHLALLAAVLAADDDDLVVATDLERHD